VVNDFVFVAGNQALRENGDLGAGVAVPPTRNWGGQNAFRRQVHYVIKERLEPSLKGRGSALEQSLKAQVYIRGVNNFPDFMDVWSQYFRDIPCAVDAGAGEGLFQHREHARDQSDRAQERRRASKAGRRRSISPRSRAMGHACAPANWCSRPG
jgi:enamine deaminase RidA (YjgF/YER057c/UK114 family)